MFINIRLSFVNTQTVRANHLLGKQEVGVCRQIHVASPNSKLNKHRCLLTGEHIYTQRSCLKSGESTWKLQFMSIVSWLWDLSSTELILLANWGFDRALSLIFKDCLTLNGTSIWNPASGSSFYIIEKHIFSNVGKKKII